MDASGETFSHVFGTNATAFEIFVLECKIMGPCWLNIKDAKISTKGVRSFPSRLQSYKYSCHPQISWTKLEIDTTKDAISVFDPNDDASPKASPPLTIMSISLRTVIHLTENKREVVCASTRVYVDGPSPDWSSHARSRSLAPLLTANIDDPTPLQNQPSTLTTLVRPLFTPFPNGFEKKCRDSKRPGEQTLPLKDEKAILTQLVGTSLSLSLPATQAEPEVAASILRTDPDVIVGTDFSTLDLDVLLNRLKDLKVDHFSRVGRLRRPKWPKLLAQRNTGLLAGRLICDLSSDGSKVRPPLASCTSQCSPC